MKKKKLVETQLFLAKLLLLSVPLYIIIWLGVDLSFLQEITTKSVISALNLIGIESNRFGFEITSSGFLFHISRDCTGWKGMLFLFSLIIATKSTLKKKIVGLSVTIPSFFSFNLLRIIIMVWIGIYDIKLFEILHDFIWQISMIFVVIILWLIWAGLKINNSGPKKKHVV